MVKQVSPIDRQIAKTVKTRGVAGKIAYYTTAQPLPFVYFHWVNWFDVAFLSIIGTLTIIDSFVDVI